MKKVLVTGGLGYLGGYLVQSLLADGRFAVRIGSKRINHETLPHWLREEEIVQLDMLSETDLEAASKGVDYIIHLAALNEIECARRPDYALLVNGYATMRLADMAVRHGVERIIYMSTAHVYAAPLVGYFDESVLPRPCHPYAISKRVGEDFILAKNGLEKVVMRLSNAFGRPVYADINRWGLVVNDFCRQAVINSKIIIKSSGKQYRDFIPFSDVAKAVVHLLDLPLGDTKDNIFNVGGKVMSILEMAELVSARCEVVVGNKASISVQGEKEHELTPVLNYDCSKIKASGLTCEGFLEEEIDRLLLYCKEVFVQ